MNNDLISRSALKKALEVTQYNDIEDLTRTERLIDNAPTVEQSYQEPKDYIKNKLDYSRPHGDLISRTWLKEHKFTTQVCNGVEIEDVDVVAVATIDNAPTVEIPTELCKGCRFLKDCETCEEKLRPQGEWIPISERLPDLFEVVLVTDETGKVFEYERRPLDEEWNVCEIWTFLGRKIIAWMPLPNPYKEADND